MIVDEYSAEALSGLNGVMGWGRDGCGLWNLVSQALVIALGMIVRHELPDCGLTRRDFRGARLAILNLTPKSGESFNHGVKIFTSQARSMNQAAATSAITIEPPRTTPTR
jgi:hypothetical protein